MVNRKGIGYILEVLAAMLVMFAFVLGNTPDAPATDWGNYQRQVMSQDLTYVMERTGDIDDFVRNGETGTINTVAQTLSRQQLEVSGTIENVPISTQIVGFHVLENDRENITIDSVDSVSDNECYENNDLGEIEPNDGEVMRSENSRDGSYLYIADTDPDISGGNGDLDYDTLWIDNGTRCQFSASEGPYYIDEFFYWGNSSGEEHYDINQMYTPDEQVELFLATQVADLKPVLDSRVNGIDTGLVIDTMAADRGNLDSYDILVFRERDTLDSANSVLNQHKDDIQDFLQQGSVLLMADLEKDDFYSGGNLADNFITSTGLKWVGLGYATKPADPAGGSFTGTSESRQLENYFEGVNGNEAQLDLAGSGNISSSNRRYFKQSPALVNSDTGRYETSDWNATNYTMDQVDPDSISGYPDSACVESSKSSALTRGEFDFRNYENDDYDTLKVISTRLGDSSSYCNNKYFRALNIDRDGDQDYGEENEGPFLEGERVEVNDKLYTVSFPSSQALETGEAAELVYIGDASIEAVNYRTSFNGFSGRRFARMGYKQSYNPDERKMIASVLHWLSEDSAGFGEQEESDISTEVVGGVKENTFIPYRVNLRWRQP